MLGDPGVVEALRHCWTLPADHRDQDDLLVYDFVQAAGVLIYARLM